MSKSPFAPIGNKSNVVSLKPKSKWEIVCPIPADAPAPPERHPTIGKPSEKWAYRDENGRLLGYACRFDKGENKEFRPLALYRDASGALEWRWEAWPVPRPLYGLDRLASRPGSRVIITEGEKACDAAGRLFPDSVTITSPNGSKSAGKADWRSIIGRAVVIWPDADEAGAKYAEDVARLCMDAGAASVAIVALPHGVAEGWDAADAEKEGWTQQQAAQLIASAKPSAKETPRKKAPADDGADHDKSERRRRPPARDSFIGLTVFCDFWHGPDGTAYVTVPANGHRENHKVFSRGFRGWLSRQSYEETGGAPGGQAIEDALRFFEARALYDGPERKPMLRVGSHNGRWYIDLCDAAWRVIEIRPDGWSILEKHELPFVRTGAMLPLPVPEAGALIETLRPFVNVSSDDDFMSVIAWLVAALHAGLEFPILFIQGEQGTGKSFFSQILRLLVDPNIAPIRTFPKDEEDLLIAAKNAHVIAFDNASHIPPPMSDALCRVAKGAGLSTRVKYTNDEEHVVWTRNPILINGIPSLAERPDLARRALIIHLRPIPDEERKSEDDAMRDWEKVAPGVLGALCDALAAALKHIGTVKLARSSSMAYFEKLIEAASPGLGWESGAFSAAYAANRADLEAAAFEADAVAVAIAELIRDDYPRGWSGAPTRLLDLLSSKVAESVKRTRSWPQTAQSLGAKIERVKPLLRQRGIIIERGKSGGERVTTIVPKSGGEGA
jgi:hypothetical protein